MKRYVGFLLVVLGVVSASAQDLQTLAQQDIIGTGRYVGMAGAMSAIGGDASAVFDNPASLGVYDHFEAQFTLDVQWNNASFRGSDMYNDTRKYVMPSTASVVFVTNPVTRKVAHQKDALTVVMRDEEVMRHAFYLGYRRMKNFRLYSKSAMANPIYEGLSTYSTTTFNSEEYGYVNEFMVSWAMNWRNRLFVGAGLDISDYNYQKVITHDRSYFDPAVYDYENMPISSYDFDYTEQNTLMKGVGVGGRLGVMGRPTNWLTLSLGVATPTAGKLKVSQVQTMDQYYDSITPTMQHASAWYYGIDYGTNRYNRKFSMPVRVDAGVAFNVLNYVQISGQYDFARRDGMNDIHSIRGGIEVRPMANLHLNVGYAYTSTFKAPLNYVAYTDGTSNMQEIMNNAITPVYQSEREPYSRFDTDYHYTNGTHTIGAGIGYEGKNVSFQLAYQYNRMYFDLLPDDGSLLPGENGELFTDTPHDMQATTHRLVLSFAFLH